MPRSCWFLLVLLGALTWVYHEHVLAGLAEPVPDWGLSFLAAVFSVGAVASLIDAVQKRGVAAALRRADRGEAPRDGEFAAAVGELHPIGEPLLSPIGGVPCVAYEYEMRGEGVGVAAYSGHALTPSVVRGPGGETRLCGYPDLDAVPFQELGGGEAHERASRYVASARFEVMKVGDVLSAMRELYRDDDGSLSLDWKSKDASPPDPGRLALKEKLVRVGEPVRVLGIWSQRAGGLVNAWDRNILLKLYAKDSKSIPSGSFAGRLVMPLLVLALVHGVLWFPYQSRQRALRGGAAERLCEAARTGDLDSLSRGLAPGLADAVCPDGATPLFRAANAAVTERLLEAGADPSAETAEGETALHRALVSYQVDQVRLLLEAGADPNLTSRRNGLTPLWILGDSGPPELRQMLLDAGAVDDRVTAETGSPLPQDGGPAVDVCRRYLEAIAAGHVGAANALSTDDHQGYWGRDVTPAAQRDLPVRIERFIGYATGDAPGSTATVSLTGPRADGEPSTRTFQLVRWETSWRVHRLAIGYAAGPLNGR
jgi:hypothetical protein